MNNCIFCQIVKGGALAYKIYEDEVAIGILDLFPNIDGQTLIISKEHYSPDFTALPEDIFQKFLLSAKKAAELLKEKLEAEMVALVIEGTGVSHFHIKLYPLKAMTGSGKPTESAQRIFYSQYPGFIDTRLGPKASDEKLKEIAQKFKIERN